MERGAEVGFPQGGALGVQADGQSPLAGWRASLADFETGLPAKEVLEQGPDDRGCELRVAAWGSVGGWPTGEGGGELIQGPGLEFDALGQVPELHQAGRIRPGGEAVLAQPMQAGDGLGCGRRGLRERGRRLRGPSLATDTGRGGGQ